MSRIIFSAPFVFAFVFFIVTVWSNYLGVFYPYSVGYYLYLSGALIIFTLFYVVARFIKLPRFTLFKTPLLSQDQAVRIYFYFMIFGLFLNVLNLSIVVGPWFFLPSQVGIYRGILTMEGGSPAVPGISLFNFFFFAALPMLLVSGRGIGKYKKFIFLLMFVFFVYISTARATLFFSVLMGFFFYFINRKMNLKLILSIIFCGVALFLLFGLVGSLVGKPMTVNIIFYSYLMGGSHVVSMLLSNLDQYTNVPFLTFNSLQQVLIKLGLMHRMGVAPYLFTPYPTNVYSVFGTYLFDYGIVGSLIIMAILGFFSGYIEQLFYRAPNNNYYRLVFALNLTVLCLGVFADYYLSSGIVWMTIVLGMFFFTYKVEDKKLCVG